MARTIRRIDQRLTDTRLADLRRDILAADQARAAGQPHPTQRDLARRYGVSQTFVSLAKNGKRRAAPTTEDVAA